MVKFYIARVKAGKIKLEDVPVRWRTEVANVIENEKNAGGM